MIESCPLPQPVIVFRRSPDIFASQRSIGVGTAGLRYANTYMVFGSLFPLRCKQLSGG
jgi:hypothetical protein